MGLFFKKSKNLGLFKLNFSKSGIGMSFGVKGFRISKNSKGTYLNAGKNGFYYRKKIDVAEPEEQIQENQENSKETAIIYESPELASFSIKISLAVLLTILFGVGFMLFNHPLRSMLSFVCGFVFIFVYILKNSELFKSMLEQGKKINELKSQNLNVEVKQGVYNSNSDEAKRKRNESKYKEYRYSYENYKKEE